MSFPTSLSGAAFEPQARTSAWWLERALVGCLFALAFCAPHSIAATQLVWVLGLLVWVARWAVRPRRALQRTPVDYALLGFFILTFVSALLSYDPDVSIGKLRGASLFTIVYLVAQNVRSRRVLRLLAFTLLASCMINVVYATGWFVVGRGVKVNALSADSPLRAAGVLDGDTITKVEGQAVRTPSDVEHALVGQQTNATTLTPAHLRVYRLEFFHDLDAARGALLPGDTPEARVGIVSWSRGRDERAAGFYGHYTTYAEVLQLTASLAVGLLVALRRRRTQRGALLALAIAGISIALLLTVTRASWLSFLISSCVIVLTGAWSRRAVLVIALGALLVVPAGLYVLQQKRQVGFFDRKDGSITWRATVYREGFHLLISRPRHLLVGVGMDSLKRHWREWGLFDQGRLPIGHMHSTPLQLALERGLPAFCAWLVLLGIYARMLWRLTRRLSDESEWVERGIALGALGGAVGFFTSGLVHYNFGDSEVVMVFYFIMGLALVVERFARQTVVGAMG